MRKRNIKTVAHWVIMSILLLFPILMVGVSSFAKEEQTVTVTDTYEYETNDVNARNDLIDGNIYQFTFDFSTLDSNTYLFDVYALYDFKTVDTNTFSYCNQSARLFYNYAGENSTNNGLIITGKLSGYYARFYNMVYSQSFYVVFNDDYFNTNVINYTMFSASDYLGEVTHNVDIQEVSYKQEINNWCNGFKNLPVNQWYGQLLNVIGVGQTTNSVMNVIYVYPLYVLWVYLIDLIVDCLLVIIYFGHNALSRLGGDND